MMKSFMPKHSSKSKKQEDLCEACGQRPKFVEKNGTVHPYCGRTCARNQQPLCKLQGCHEAGKPAFGGYCSSRHSRNAVQHGQAQACTQCRKQPSVIGDLCLSCNNLQNFAETRLRELDTNDVEFRSLAANVTGEWNGSGSVIVERAYAVFLPRDVFSARKAYRTKLEGDGQVSIAQTFHSAQCICDLGINDSRLCTWQSCGICNILKSSFTSFEFGIKSKTGRFGPGIYSFWNPALADQFSTSSTSSPYRVMIACEVTISSKAARSSKNVDSIQDERGVFFSKADAIIPKYVIMYSK